MSPIIFNADDETATTTLGHALADVLPPGTTVALCGTLGAGKTRLVQAIAEGLGVNRRDVVSPTFVLIQEYRGRRAIYHIDAYRLRGDDEFQQLGPDEYFESEGLVLIEWADRVESSLPREYVEIRLEVTGEKSRRFEIRAVGWRHEEVLRRLAQRWRGPSMEIPAV
jgi:tRNA threonylcarbamoyladenosine biosynthesis protein TsaE